MVGCSGPNDKTKHTEEPKNGKGGGRWLATKGVGMQLRPLPFFSDTDGDTHFELVVAMARQLSSIDANVAVQNADFTLRRWLLLLLLLLLLSGGDTNAE